MKKKRDPVWSPHARLSISFTKSRPTPTRIYLGLGRVFVLRTLLPLRLKKNGVIIRGFKTGLFCFCFCFCLFFKKEKSLET